VREPKSPVRLEPHIGVVQEFVSSILEDRQPGVTGEDGRAAVEICEACLVSARIGQAVAIRQ
jgi:predicted dehydrogenase